MIFDFFLYPLFLVDNDVKIYRFNTTAASSVEIDVNEIYQKKSGESLRCLCAAETKGGCGHAEHCRECVVRNSVNQSVRGKKYPQGGKDCDKNGAETKEIFLVITAAPCTYGERLHVRLIPEDITKLTQLHGLLALSPNKLITAPSSVV